MCQVAAPQCFPLPFVQVINKFLCQTYLRMPVIHLIIFHFMTMNWIPRPANLNLIYVLRLDEVMNTHGCFIFFFQVTKGREQLEEAKRTYEIMNSELHDELPALYDSRVLFYVNNLQTLFSAEQLFHSESNKVGLIAFQTTHNSCSRHGTKGILVKILILVRLLTVLISLLFGVTIHYYCG